MPEKHRDKKTKPMTKERLTHRNHQQRLRLRKCSSNGYSHLGAQTSNFSSSPSPFRLMSHLFSFASPAPVCGKLARNLTAAKDGIPLPRPRATSCSMKYEWPLNECRQNAHS